MICRKMLHNVVVCRKMSQFVVICRKMLWYVVNCLEMSWYSRASFFNSAKSSWICKFWILRYEKERKFSNSDSRPPPSLAYNVIMLWYVVKCCKIWIVKKWCELSLNRDFCLWDVMKCYDFLWNVVLSLDLSQNVVNGMICKMLWNVVICRTIS